MKRRYFILFFIFLVFLGFWFSRTEKEKISKPNLPSNARTNSSTGNGSNGAPSPVKRTETIRKTSDEWAERERQRIESIERGKDEWRTPIEFYGKVVDENENPIAGAQIDFGTNDLSPTGSSDYKGASDARGLFSIEEIQGKLLVVKVTKDGYYTSKRDNDSFYYAGQNVNFVPNENSPVTFHLRKKDKRSR